MMNEQYYRKQADVIEAEIRTLLRRRCPLAARCRLKRLFELDREYRELYGILVPERELEQMQQEINDALGRRAYGKGR